MNGARKSQAGVAAVEFALLLVVMVPLLFGMAEYGRAMYQYNTIAKAVRSGARFLSLNAPGDANARIHARCLVIYGMKAVGSPPTTPKCAGTPKNPDMALVPGLGLAPDQVIISDSSNDPAMKGQSMTANGVTIGKTNLVRVSVSGYRFRSLGGYIAPAFTFDPISVTMTQVTP